MADCTAADCFDRHVLAAIKRGKRTGDQGYGCCPAHDDSHASMSIRRGSKVRYVWYCETECDPADIRDGLSSLGISAGCLGTYGTSRVRPHASGLHSTSHDAARRAAEAKLRAIDDLLRRDLTPAMRSIQIKLVIEGGEMPADRREFLALAERAGVCRRQRYVAWEQVYVSSGQGQGVAQVA